MLVIGGTMINMFYFICFIGLFYGCNNKTEITAKYYEFTYTDSSAGTISSDTVHVILYQLGGYQNLFPVSYTLTNDPSLDDTIKFIFTVKFGGYSQTPTHYKSIHTTNDTMVVLYTHMETVGILKQFSSNTINSVQTSLKPTYTSVQSVEIIKSTWKYLTFESRLIQSGVQ